MAVARLALIGLLLAVCALLEIAFDFTRKDKIMASVPPPKPTPTPSPSPSPTPTPPPGDDETPDDGGN